MVSVSLKLKITTVDKKSIGIQSASFCYILKVTTSKKVKEEYYLVDMERQPNNQHGIKRPIIGNFVDIKYVFSGSNGLYDFRQQYQVVK